MSIINKKTIEKIISLTASIFYDNNEVWGYTKENGTINIGSPDEVINAAAYMITRLKPKIIEVIEKRIVYENRQYQHHEWHEHTADNIYQDIFGELEESEEQPQQPDTLTDCLQKFILQEIQKNIDNKIRERFKNLLE